MRERVKTIKEDEAKHFELGWKTKKYKREICPPAEHCPTCALIPLSVQRISKQSATVE